MSDLIVVSNSGDIDNGKLLVDPITGLRLLVVINNRLRNRILEKRYYSVSLNLSHKDYRKKKGSPYLFSVDDPNLKEVENPYERIISQSFKKQTSPSSNSSLANLLETVGQGLYSSKRRMFFELLQNADDCAAESGVQVKFELSDTHFILTHNGMPFSKQDFDSIISAAKSTKSANKKKTGYKGIGFKSVFTNSTEVVIFSGGFKFAFDKDLPLYNDFKSFYFLVNEYVGKPTEQENFLERFEPECRDFRGVKDIPWQLLPIWQDMRSEDLNGTIFSEVPNVSIALRMDKKMLEEYHRALTEILQHPKFMLFMRSTNRIQYKDGKQYYSVKKIVDRSGNITLLNSFIEHCPRETFHIENSGYIPVNNAAFSSAGIPIIKSKRTNSAGIEETVLAHINEKQEILSEINDIPDRLASAENIEISFAIATDAEGGVIPLCLNYGNIESCFYSYLPMNEQRFKLPLFVNADFDLHSDREGVKADSPWNAFIFYHIGRNLVRTVSNIASTSQKNYLNLLLDNSFDETNQEIEKLSHAFNRGYKEGLHEIPVIINDEGEKVLAQDIILDVSELSSDVSNDLFYRLFTVDKRQPYGGIDSSILNNDIFDILSICVDDVVQTMVKNRAVVQEWIDSANVDEQKRLLEWLHRNNAPETFVKQLRIIAINKSMFSIEQLLSSENFVVLSPHDIYVEVALNSLGLGTLIIAEDDILRNYLNQSDQQTFDIVSKRLSQRLKGLILGEDAAQPTIKCHTLTVDEKLYIVQYLKGLSNIGPKAIGALPIFNNVKKIPTAFCDMVRFRNCAPMFMEDYMISEEDYIPEIQQYLVSPEDEFDKIIWAKRNILGLSPYELLSYNTTDNEAYLITLIEEAESNEDLNMLIDNVYIASDKVKIKFLENVKEITLKDDVSYDETTFESRAISLAIATLDEPSAFAAKIIYKGKSVSEYSIDEDIVCKYKQGETERSVKIPLAKLLPEYANNTLGIHCLKRIFEKSKDFEKLLKTHQKPLSEVYNELNKILLLPTGEFPIWPNGKGTGLQYLFISYFRKQMKGWYNRYIPDIIIENQKDNFVIEILDFLYDNNIIVNASPFTYNLSRYFKGKYFSDCMVSDSESLISIIEKWAGFDEKRQKFLRDNGVKDCDANEIRFRRMLCENQQIDFIENLSVLDINRGLSFVCSNPNLAFPLKGDYQVEVIKQLLEKSGVNLKRSINLQKLASLSQEWNTSEYNSWKQTHYPYIYLYDGNMPCYINCDNIHIGELETDENFYYDSNSKILYININEELSDILFSIAQKSGIPFDMEDYRVLCMEGKISISKDELKAKNEEIQSLKSRIAELERLLTGNIHIGTTDSRLSKKDQYAALIEAQQALIAKRSDWRFPIGFGERKEDGTPVCFSAVVVQNENEEGMEIVLKSYKKTDERFHINPEEWDAVVKRGALLLVYTPFYGQLDIVRIPKEELVRKQSSIQLSFSTSNLDEEKYPNKISEFASILHYFQHITFDFARFHISKDAVSVKDISVKRDLNVTSAEEDDI